MRRLIVNGDDLGLTSGVNQGILRAHHEGILTSASLMVTMPAWEEAVALARATPSLAVGLHLTLTAGRPLAGAAPSLTGPDGRFLRLPALAASADLAEVEREVWAQVDRFRATGLALSHIDSHHHAHVQVPAIRAAVLKVAAELGVPVRSVACPFDTRFYGATNVTPAALIELLGALPEGAVDLMTHPGVVDEPLREISSYVDEREAELESLTCPAVREAIALYGVQLITYAELRG